jgi:hypothetical protein
MLNKIKIFVAKMFYDFTFIEDQKKKADLEIQSLQIKLDISKQSNKVLSEMLENYWSDVEFRMKEKIFEESKPKLIGGVQTIFDDINALDMSNFGGSVLMRFNVTDTLTFSKSVLGESENYHLIFKSGESDVVRITRAATKPLVHYSNRSEVVELLNSMFNELKSNVLSDMQTKNSFKLSPLIESWKNDS